MLVKEMAPCGTKMAIHTVDAGKMATEMAMVPIPLKMALYTRDILKMANLTVKAPTPLLMVDHILVNG